MKVSEDHITHTTRPLAFKKKKVKKNLFLFEIDDYYMHVYIQVFWLYNTNIVYKIVCQIICKMWKWRQIRLRKWFVSICFIL